ncbi:MAG TPA: beta-galactosidase small subunit, partial [Bacillota bacterium]|nr:beta-galactosidase small subunit [Bacillota bacterium]
FTRPYSGIDGEKGWVRNLTWKRFKPQGTLYRLKRAKAFDTGRDVVIETVIEVDFADFKNGAIVYSKCTIDGSRRIDVNMTFKLNPMVGDMPRVGAEHTIASGYEDLAYYGLGPMENYSDRKSAAKLGIFKGRVEDHHFPYNPPSECGGHEETRWVSLSNEAGQNIKFVSPIPFHFDVHHSTIEDYLNAGHDHEIVKRKETIVHIDAAHAGIGGGMGWSTFLGPEHRVEPSTYMLTYAIVF